MKKWFCGIWPIEPSAPLSSAMTRATVPAATPAPPWAFGTVMARRPASDSRSSSSTGRMRSRSRRAAPTARVAATSVATAIASASSRMMRAVRLRSGGATKAVAASRRRDNSGRSCGAPSLKESYRGHAQFQAWRGGATPFSRRLPTWKYFQRTGIVQRVRAGVAPIAVEVVLRPSVARAGRVRAACWWRGSRSRSSAPWPRRPEMVARRPARRLAWVGPENGVDRVARPLEQRLGGVQPDLEVADRRDGEHVLVTRCCWPLSIHGPDVVLPDEPDRLFDRAARDAGVDGRLDDLRDGTGGGRLHAAEISGDQRPPGPMRTLSIRTLPLAVVRWPKPDQVVR